MRFGVEFSFEFFAMGIFNSNSAGNFVRIVALEIDNWAWREKYNMSFKGKLSEMN